MTRPWVLRAVVLAVIALLITYVARNTYWADVSVPSPLRGEAVTNPFYAAQRLAESLGATTEVRQTIGVLGRNADVLVLSDWRWELIAERREHIEAWVESGGHLVVDRTLVTEGDFTDWSGIRWEYPQYESDEEDGSEAANTSAEPAPAVEPPAPDVSFDGNSDLCTKLSEVNFAAAAVENGRMFSVCTLDSFGFLATDHDLQWGLMRDGNLHLLRVGVGEGSVTALNLAPFGNQVLTDVDHAALFAAATQLRRGAHLIFVSETEQPSLLALIWKYGAPVVVLSAMALAALLWRGAVRFGPLAPAAESARRSLAEQIRGTGQFALRLGDGKALHAAAIRALHEAAERRIVRYAVLTQHERVTAIAERAQLDAENLATALNFSGARRAHELAQTIALIEQARRRILE